MTMSYFKLAEALLVEQIMSLKLTHYLLYLYASTLNTKSFNVVMSSWSWAFSSAGSLSVSLAIKGSLDKSGG